MSKLQTMYKIIKFDPTQLDVGVVVFDIIEGWQEVTVIRPDGKFETEEMLYLEDGRGSLKHKRPMVVAMEILKSPKEIPTKYFIWNDNNWYVKYDSESDCWLVLNEKFNRTYGCCYYTKENAVLLANILDEG